jgi:hypothetical protein
MDVIRVVQFLHPGPEHGWDRAFTTTTGWKDWNRGDHKRKFLVAEGSCTRNPRESPARGSFTFWGEWEPQSEVRRLVSNKGAHYPSWLHTPAPPTKRGGLPSEAEWSNAGMCSRLAPEYRSLGFRRSVPLRALPSIFECVGLTDGASSTA